ncbi:glycerophosphoryl diester phosphodiesterase [Nitratireductor indicus C115]|uniref:Glycerophosphoryl diester phosphodiesterase n=1 Tax=Nitratireductor indicus C115 TaxID=1231190 RepID=K2PQ01_9HYPH|nr:glycerophosphoryl diester phosphodiesterase [Nitratireductor indicus C115]
MIMKAKETTLTRIASHRGGTLEFGDSTPAGFAVTARMPLEEVEFDLHPTLDGKIVVHHDPTLNRTTDKVGAIVQMTWQDVRAATIDFSRGEHPLLLEELCEIYTDSPVQFRCEIKPGENGGAYCDFVPKVIAGLDACGRLMTTNFSSFLMETLDEIASHTDRPRLWLLSPPVLRQLGSNAVIELATAHSVPEIGVHIDDASAALMNKVTAAGLDFGCWAAHSASQIDKALNLGVKVFTTDRPSLAISRREKQSSEGRPA